MLIRLAEIIEKETEAYYKMDPDPFDDRHPGTFLYGIDTHALMSVILIYIKCLLHVNFTAVFEIMSVFVAQKYELGNALMLVVDKLMINHMINFKKFIVCVIFDGFNK